MSTITAHQFRTALRDWLGDRVKFHPDWPHATTNGGFNPHGILHHWDAIPRRYRLGTHLRVLRHGRTGLPGPLCHCAPARNGDLWVIGWGNCNHAGLGDSRVLDQIRRGRFDGSPAPAHEDADGNVALYGLEYMYHPDDGPMPDEQFETGALAAAAICEAHGWDNPDRAAGSNLDHYEWAARKWDREIDNLAHRTREGVRAALAGEFGGDDMNVMDLMRHNLTATDGELTVARALRLAASSGVDEDALADKIVARLGGSADAATIKAAVKEALREGVE